MLRRLRLLVLVALAVAALSQAALATPDNLDVTKNIPGGQDTYAALIVTATGYFGQDYVLVTLDVLEEKPPQTVVTVASLEQLMAYKGRARLRGISFSEDGTELAPLVASSGEKQSLLSNRLEVVSRRASAT